MYIIGVLKIVCCGTRERAGKADSLLCHVGRWDKPSRI